MPDTVIRAEAISKRYVLGRRDDTNGQLRNVLGDSLRALGRRARHPLAGSDQAKSEFWALRDVSFDVQRGDRVGIIGRNGAGKSTLLKILSRITEPTTGRMRIRGRIASLLEVGTGFHPELTGRENIFLNGAILGMTRVEIRRKFDEIVAFAEVERFLETPVKRFSSGMHVRLAFAVAAHLEPEILVVDEVLAVGDAQFQKKCLGKMREVGAEGRTVLFVSHQMNAIEQLCSRTILLRGGQITHDSRDVRGLIREYMAGALDEGDQAAWINPTGHAHESEWFLPLRFALTDETGTPLQMPVSNGDEMWVEIDAEIRVVDPALTVGYALYSEDGTLLYWSLQTDGPEHEWPVLRPGVQTLRSRIPKHLLNEGNFRLELYAGLYSRHIFLKPGAHSPAIYLTIRGGLSDSPYWMAKRPGELAPIMRWETRDRPEVPPAKESDVVLRSAP